MRGAAFIFLMLLFGTTLFSQSVKIARLKYEGGGDWYVSPTSLPNLIAFCNEHIKTNINPQEEVVEIGSPKLFNYPFVHMTGHGNIHMSSSDVENLKKYLLSGGFLHINDSYGMDQYIRANMKLVFPNTAFVELPYDHPIFKQTFVFDKGLPKIHEHNGHAPQALGLIIEGRLLCLYNYECDLGDGWEDAQVHNDPLEVRTKALQMGANIVEYVFNFRQD